MTRRTPILVVGEHDEHRAAVRAILPEPAYQVLEARTGKETLRTLLQTEVALLVTDIVLPDMTGFDVAQLVRDRPRTASLPVILATPHATDPDVIARGMRAGANDVLGLPLNPDLLRAKVAFYAQLATQRTAAEHAMVYETERSLLELQLASERRYRGLAEALPNILWTAHPDGTVDYFNRRWFEYTGLSVEGAGGSWTSALHPDDLAPAIAAWRRALAGGELHQAEFRLRRADGAYRWHLCRVVPEHNEAGEISGWLGSLTDIDDERRAREALAEFKGTLDAELDAVMIFDRTTLRLLYANQGARVLLGYSPSELEEKRLPGFVAEVDEAGVRALLAPLVSGERNTLTLETRFLQRDAHVVPVEVSLQLMPSAGGRLVAIARDITDRLRNRRERELLYRETADALRARDEFLSIASHELRTPISALQLQLELVLAELEASRASLTPERFASKMQVAARQVERLTRLVSQLLDVSRITSGRLSLEREDFDLAALVHDVADRFAEAATKACTAVSVVAPEPVIGAWDRGRIEQVVTNLVSNALKFCDAKPIEISVTSDAARAELTVRDHGIGIAPADLDRIFSRFTQVSPTRKHGGLGLGLYITRSIVEAHGGTIRAESDPESGTLFVVELPLHQEDAHAANHREPDTVRSGPDAGPGAHPPHPGR